MKFHAQAKEGGIDLGSDFARAKFKQFLKDNNGMRLEIRPMVPESKKMRGYFEGCLVALATFYDHHLDWKNSEDQKRMRETIKAHFNPDYINFGGKVEKIAKSTAGREALKKVTEDTLDWLKENYSPPDEAINPEHYKKWRDTVFPHGGPPTYLEYLLELGIIKK